MNLAAISQQIMAELKASKRKAGMVVLLLAVALVLVIRLAVKSGGATPNRAAAAVPTAVAAKPAGVPDEAVREWQARQARCDEYLSRLDGTIARDLFEPNPALFPLPAGGGQPGPNGTGPADPSAPDEVERHAEGIRKEAEALGVQTTILSDSPTAIINGRVLRVGDWINGFQLVAIDAKGCVVVKENVRVALRLTR